MLYYIAQYDALVKLGMASGPGPIAYKSRPSQHNPSFDYTADKREQLWAEFDQEGRITGEESALGMPSPGMKQGAWSGGYGDSSGAVAQGSFDGNKQSPHKDHIISSAMQESFKTLEDYDKGYAPESPMTQPHGSKYANNAFAGSSMMGTNELIPKGPKAPKAPKLAPGGNTQQLQEDPGMNLVQQVQQFSHQRDMNNSYASQGTRLTGSPL
jgi:hypothetical protein